MNNVVDSSAWLEYIGDTKNGENFAKVIQDTNSLIIPSIVLFEVYKKLIRFSDEKSALTGLITMKAGAVVIDLDEELAIMAVLIQKKHGLPMADSIILATARFFNAILWTQDSDFKGIEGVKYFPK